MGQHTVKIECECGKIREFELWHEKGDPSVGIESGWYTDEEEVVCCEVVDFDLLTTGTALGGVEYIECGHHITFDDMWEKAESDAEPDFYPDEAKGGSHGNTIY